MRGIQRSSERTHWEVQSSTYVIRLNGNYAPHVKHSCARCIASKELHSRNNTIIRESVWDVLSRLQTSEWRSLTLPPDTGGPSSRPPWPPLTDLAECTCKCNWAIIFDSRCEMSQSRSSCVQCKRRVLVSVLCE
ncbi:unnamed protein product [Pieris brassicae]|uniref:Uncharacterized protein n=1 Tax=Pieris brassicae TaxID=7116 RepID=A0A9P0SSY4_PIEBR|nr:unnamed protein product [Pieris brassicae]